MEQRIVLRHGFFRTTVIEQQVTQILPRRNTVGIDLQRAFVTGNGLVLIIQLLSEISQIGMPGSFGRIKLQSVLICLDRFMQFAFSLQVFGHLHKLSGFVRSRQIV